MALNINSALPISDLTQQFKNNFRIQIPNFFQHQGALALGNYASAFANWNISLNSGEKHFDVFHENRQGMQPQFYQQLEASVGRDAVSGFQYFFENYPIYDSYHNGVCPKPLTETFTFLNSEIFLSCIRNITGLSDIQFADAQLTKFSKGHFLTEHDDNIQGKQRLIAYVINLTPVWRVEWGGLLMFHDKNTQIKQVFTPIFNSLNLFSVPQRHSVSQVASFVTASRFSITGWLRSGADPLEK